MMKLLSLLFFVLTLTCWHCHARTVRPDDQSRRSQVFNGPYNNDKSNQFTANWWDQFWSSFQLPNFSTFQGGFFSPPLWSSPSQNSSELSSSHDDRGYNVTIISVATVGVGKNRKTLGTETIKIEFGPGGKVHNGRRSIMRSDGSQDEQKLMVGTEESENLATTVPGAPVQESRGSSRSSTTTQAPVVQPVRSGLEEEYLRELEINRRRAQSEIPSALSYGSSSSTSRASLSTVGSRSYSTRAQNSFYGGPNGRGRTVTVVQRRTSGSSVEQSNNSLARTSVP